MRDSSWCRFPRLVPCVRHLSLLGLLTGLAPLHAQVSMPPVNLGVTTLTDGMSGPGWLLEPLTFEHYSARRFAGPDGTTIPGSNSFSATSNLFHLAYSTRSRILGGFFGMEFLLPVGRLELDTDFGPAGKASGLGDLIFSPLILHWPGRTLMQKPYFSRFSVLAVLPTGQYDPAQPLNVGNNLLSLTGYYAFTWMFAPNWETSWRLNYLWNSRNSDPFEPLDAGSTQPGQAVHLNYAFSRALGPRFRAGVNGYHFAQVTAHRMDGQALPKSKERVTAAGPAVKWAGERWNAFANVDVEFGARNRPEGFKAVLRAQWILGAK